MIKIKNKIMNIYKYILFVYEHYIQEDWSYITKTGQFFLKPAWFVRSILMWIYSIVCFPLVLIHMEFVSVMNDLDLDPLDFFTITLNFDNILKGK